MREKTTHPAGILATFIAVFLLGYFLYVSGRLLIASVPLVYLLSGAGLFIAFITVILVAQAHERRKSVLIRSANRAQDQP